MTTEQPTKRRKTAEPKRSGKNGSAAQAVTEKDVEECMSGIAEWFPLATNAAETFKSQTDTKFWKRYFKMREHYPGIPLVLYEDDEGEDSDDEGKGDEEKIDNESAEEDAENQGSTLTGKESADEPVSQAGPAEETDCDALKAAGSKPPVATKLDASDDATSSSPKDEDADVGDDDDDSEGDGSDAENDEDSDGSGTDEEEEEEEEVDPLDGEELIDQEADDPLEICMGVPALDASEAVFAEPEKFLQQAHVLVDKIYLREHRQLLQTSIRIYSLARPQAIDIKLNFYHKQRDEKKEHILDVFYRFVQAKDVVQELPHGDEWKPVVKSFIDSKGKLNRKITITSTASTEVRNALLGGSELDAGGGIDDKEVTAVDLWRILLTAVGFKASQVVKEYSTILLEDVLKRCNPGENEVKAIEDDTYDNAGPDFEDPFDTADYPTDQECAQQ